MNVIFDCLPTMMAALLGASALYAIAYGVQKYNQLSAKLSDVTNRLDTLSETTRHDFATQWQRQFQSTLAEQQNELETIIKVQAEQAEQLAKQSKQISLMHNMMTQNNDIQAEQDTLIDSLQRQQETQQNLIDLLQRQQESFKVDVDKQKVMINNHTQYLEFVRCYASLNITNSTEINRLCSVSILLE